MLEQKTMLMALTIRLEHLLVKTTGKLNYIIKIISLLNEEACYSRAVISYNTEKKEVFINQIVR